MTSKLLPTPTEISLVRLPNTFCIPPAFWILTILNKDERKDCVRMGKKKKIYNHKQTRRFISDEQCLQARTSLQL